MTMRDVRKNEYYMNPLGRLVQVMGFTRGKGQVQVRSAADGPRYNRRSVVSAKRFLSQFKLAP